MQVQRRRPKFSGDNKGYEVRDFESLQAPPTSAPRARASAHKACVHPQSLQIGQELSRYHQEAKEAKKPRKKPKKPRTLPTHVATSMVPV